MDKIGLVTITYNSAEVLKPFLDCVWAQTHKNIILYVIDNSSKDSTLKILSAESDNRLVLIENENNYGVSKANNQGILKAIEDECDQVLIINNDVEFETTLIEKLLNAQQENHCSLISPKMMYFDDPEHFWYAGSWFFKRTGYLPAHRGMNMLDKGQFNKNEKVEDLKPIINSIKYK